MSVVCSLLATTDCCGYPWSLAALGFHHIIVAKVLLFLETTYEIPGKITVKEQSETISGNTLGEIGNIRQ